MNIPRRFEVVVPSAVIAAVFFGGIATVIEAQTVASTTDATSTDVGIASTTLAATMDASSTDFAFSTSSALTASTSDATTSESNASSGPIHDSSSTAPASTLVAITASSTMPIPLRCDTAYTADLYNTLSGHYAAGATVIGSQSWTDCKDAQGHVYEFKIPHDQYAALGPRGAAMPHETSGSSGLVAIDTVPIASSTAPAALTSVTTVESASATSADDSEATSTADGSDTATGQASAATSTDALPTASAASSSVATSSASQ